MLPTGDVFLYILLNNALNSLVMNKEIVSDNLTSVWTITTVYQLRTPISNFKCYWTLRLSCIPILNVVPVTRYSDVSFVAFHKRFMQISVPLFSAYFCIHHSQSSYHSTICKLHNWKDSVKWPENRLMSRLFPLDGIRGGSDPVITGFADISMRVLCLDF